MIRGISAAGHLSTMVKQTQARAQARKNKEVAVDKGQSFLK